MTAKSPGPFSAPTPSTSAAPVFDDACKEAGGYEAAATRPTFWFSNWAQVAQVIEHLGGNTPAMSFESPRTWHLCAHSEFLEVYCEYHKGDNPPGPWKRKTRKLWHCAVNACPDHRGMLERIAPYDDMVRCLMQNHESDRWAIKQADGSWAFGFHKSDAESALKASGVRDTVSLMGGFLTHSWQKVHLPFRPEYPGERQWNFGPQLVYQTKEGRTPTWDKIFEHVGKNLTAGVLQNEWCQTNGITTGAHYLKLWAAWMFRKPEQRSVALQLFGPQNAGKSIFHESLGLLMTKGVAAGDRALTNSNDFNGELQGAVLIHIEEKDLTHSPSAYSKLKDWVTSPTLWIRKMHCDAYPQTNYSRFIFCTNDVGAPISFGDTRLTCIEVDPLKPGQEIPKTILFQRLRNEGPAILHALMTMDLPTPCGRLCLPIIETDYRKRMIEGTIPDFIRAIVSDTPKKPIYVKEFNDVFGPGKWPASMSETKKILSQWAPYLASRGIKVAYPHKTKKGYPIAFEVTK